MPSRPSLRSRRTLCSKFAKAGLLAFLISVPFLAGCASIPHEAPELSVELGNRVAEMETAHLNLLHRFFDERRVRIQEFITKEWVPLFAEEFFADPGVQRIWDQVCREGTAQDRVEFLRRLGPLLQEKIDAKHRELLDPLDQLERAMEERLRAEYFQIKAINNTLTSYLSSAADVAEGRDRLLSSFGAESALAAFVDTAERVTGDLVAGTKEARDLLARGEQFREQMDDLVNEVRSRTGNEED